MHDAEEAIEMYKRLLNDNGERDKIGDRARKRILKEHTFKHRARQFIDIIEGIKV